MIFPTATIDIGIDPVLVHIGSISIHWYGLMYVVGLLAGMAVAVPYAERFGISRDTAYEIFWPVLIACLIGGRLYYVVQSDLGRYLSHPQDIIATWEGGMAFYGAVFLGVPTLYIACKAKRVSFPRALDAVTLLIPLAQAFGRIGNLINGDILGYPSTIAWATRYTNVHNTFVPSHIIAYQPAAAYELLFSLWLFGLVYLLRFQFRTPGTLFALWAVMYSIGQFFLFFGRMNAIVLFGLRQAQITALVVIAVTIPAWLVWHRVYTSRHPLSAVEVPENRTEQTTTPEAAGA